MWERPLDFRGECTHFSFKYIQYKNKDLYPKMKNKTSEDQSKDMES